MGTLTALFANLCGVAIVFAFTYLWYRTSPADGSGWAMFAAVAIAVFMINPANAFVGSVTEGLLAVGLGYTWATNPDKADRGWLLFAAILSGFSTMHHLLG